MLRFHKHQMPRLLQELGLDNSGEVDGRWRVRDERGVVVNVYEPMELLVIFLARMATHNCWSQLIRFLGGRGASAYKHGFYFVLDHIHTQFNHTLSDISRYVGQADLFARAIHEKGAPAAHCIGFIDGTFRHCARPTEGQRHIYSGYYKGHGLKFQSVVGPNGMILDFYGPCPGRRGDGYLLRRSGFLTRMQQFCLTAGRHFYVYGDPAYALSRWIMRGFKGVMTPEQRAFSKAMSSVREAVEWGFSLIVRDWAFVDYTKNLKIHKQPIAKLYFVAAIMTNVKTCMMAEEHDPYGNLISNFFGVSPPSLHDYLYG